MSCNPAIGGLAKAQLVKEIDALGGEMGKIADRTAVHFRLLNSSKGPAVQSSRVQCDKQLYRLAMKAVVEHQKNLQLRQGLVDRIAVEDGRVTGVIDSTGFFYPGKAVVITTGTFLNGLIHIGTFRTPAGRAGEIASVELAESLRGLGFEMGRMKTGTPPRLKASTIDFGRLERQDSDPCPEPFSYTTETLRRGAAPLLLLVHDGRDAPPDPRKHPPVAPVLGDHPGNQRPILPVARGQGGALLRQGAPPRHAGVRGARHGRDLRQGARQLPPSRAAGKDRTQRPRAREGRDHATGLCHRVRLRPADGAQADPGDEADRGAFPRRSDQRHLRLRRGRRPGSLGGDQRGPRRSRDGRPSSWSDPRPTWPSWSTTS